MRNYCSALRRKRHFRRYYWVNDTFNKSINFKEDKIQINFNEYIQVDKSNITFFLQLTQCPQLKKGKSVILNFETDLLITLPI